MKIKFWLSALVGMAAWSLSSVATAGWVNGPCDPRMPGDPPCIEVVDGNNVWHFNGGHDGEWHGNPFTGEDFEFSNREETVDLGCELASPKCNLTLSGQVKKCQDSNGDWRIGVKVTGADVSPGEFLCNTITVGGFPWYSKDPSITPHCPFEDDCDSFIPYDPTPNSTYIGNFGAIDVSVPIFGDLVDGEHLHNVTFNPGPNANFDFTNKTFYDCDEGEGDCGIDGTLYLDGADELNIY